MPLILPGNVGSATAATGYDVANSVRFDDGSNCQMRRAGVAGGNQDKFTLSMWIKRANIGTDHPRLFTSVASGNDRFEIYFEDTNELHIEGIDNGTATLNLVTSAKFTDVSAWYHILLAVDTGQGTEANRAKLYINGVLETAFGTSTRPDQDGNIGINTNSFPIQIGERSGYGVDFDGYFAEIVFLDGAQSANTDLGEFDEDSGIWKPIDVEDLSSSKGNNGFYLDFEDSSNLGNDVFGGTDFSEANLAAIDQTTDTCTNNFATINPLDNYFAVATLAEGSLKVTCNAGNTTFITSTFGLSKGKWYWEGKLTTVGGEEAIGITDKNSTATDNYAGQTANSYSFKGNNGDIRNADENASYGGGYGASVIGVYMDLDNNKLYFAINGSIQNSGTGVAITAVASTTNGFYFPMVGDVDSDAPVWEVNFGNPVSALSSAVSDANGYGAFEYSPSDGGSASFDSAAKSFLAICTKNLATDG